MSQPANECLICLTKTRAFWSPNLSCDCSPNIHKKCWNEWVKKGNGICIICRTEAEAEPEPEPELQQQGPRGGWIDLPFWHNYRYIFILNIILYVFFCLTVLVVLQDHLQKLSLKDEL